MPYLVTDSSHPKGAAWVGSDPNYHYEYPEGLNLKPGSDLHQTLVTMILEKAYASHNVMSKRFSAWREIDRTLTVYIPTDDEEDAIKEGDSRKPTSIVFPYSYSMLETLVTYLCMSFFQDPVFRYDGVSPEDMAGAKMLELVIQQHVIRSKMMLALHTIFRDSLSYGIGIGIPSWEVRYGKRIRREKNPSVIAGEATETESFNVYDAITFEGNTLYNIDPYHYLPDPSVGVHDVQKGEFVGWIERTNLMGLLRLEDNDASIFNVQYLKHIQGPKISVLGQDDSDREIRFGGKHLNAELSKNAADIIWMTIDLIPKDYGLSNKEYPEKWYFGLASDAVIIKAQPAGFFHNMFNVAVASPDYDGYSTTPISRLEILYGLQHVLDWMFNTHVANVRKTINDMLVVDPYLVNINDLTTPKAGKIIRLRRPAWGRGVTNAVEQLQVNDVTRAHIADSAYITSWMERIAATDPSVMGQLRTGGPERLTLGEFEGTRGSAVSRLQRISMVIGLQLFQDLGYIFASQTQQLMSQELYINTTGIWEEDILKILGVDPNTQDTSRLKVSPFDISIDYDVAIRDGSVPGMNFSNAWVEVFKIISSDPELRAQFDVYRIFSHIAKNLGAKNIEQFRKVKTQVMPDDQVMNEVQKGNLRPMPLSPGV